ncbi:MAG: hypothetical protein ACI4JA_03355 [Oscillospiraceae bacterium]
MERTYNICGLTVQADFRHELMLARSAKYLCDTDKTPDIVINYDRTALENSLKGLTDFTLSDSEVMYTSYKFYDALPDFGGFMLHSSAVAVDNKAYLFSALSGTGKSTHTQQWVKLFGERACIINDDKPAILVEDGGIYACGTPWSGKSDMNMNVKVPLQGICVLERSAENFILPLDQGTAVFKILNQTMRPDSPEKMNKLLDLLDMVIKRVPVWRMGCNISTQAAQVAYDAMTE